MKRHEGKGRKQGRKIRDVMTRDVEFVGPGDTVKDVAWRMKSKDLGSFPVCEGGKVLGMITDRDLAIRVLAEGKDAGATPVRDVMSTKVVVCGEDMSVREAEAAMRERRIRRLPIVDAEGKLCGLFTIGRIAKVEDESTAGQVLRSIVRPG